MWTRGRGTARPELEQFLAPAPRNVSQIVRNIPHPHTTPVAFRRQIEAIAMALSLLFLLPTQVIG
jgi:hypothetical protein